MLSIFAFGDAAEFLKLVPSRGSSVKDTQPPRLVVGAFRFRRDRGAVRAAAEQCVEELGSRRAQTLCLVVDASHESAVFLEARARRFAGAVVGSVDIYSPLDFGRDVFAFAVCITSARHRAVVARRLAELVERPIRLRDTVVLRARRLEMTSIRSAFQEDLL